MSFAVDNSMQGSYTSAANLATGLYHEALWTSPSMSEGSHTLVITQTGAAASGVIYLDYLLYDTISTSVGSYFIDDRDERITYTPAWRQFSGTANDFQHTSSESTSPGDSFSLQFEGKSISFYGGLTTSDAGLMKANMVLDGGSPVVYTAPDPIPDTVNNLMFSSGPLSDGTHTLVVTVETEQTIWADYFLITPGTPSSPTPPPNTSTSTPSGGTPSISAGSPVPSPADSSGSTFVSSGSSSRPSGTHSIASGGSASASSPGSSPFSGPVSLSSAAPGTLSSDSASSSLPVSTSAKSTPAGIIAAAILGALLLIALVVAAIFFLCRRQRNRPRKSIEAPMASFLAPRPFSRLASSGTATSRTPLDSGGDYAVLSATASTTNLESTSSSAGDAMTPPSLIPLSPMRKLPLGPQREDPPSTALARAASTAGSSQLAGEDAPPQYSA